MFTKIARRILFIVLAAILLIIIVVFVLILLAGYRSSHYWLFAETGGAIEKKYAALGPYPVTSSEYDATGTEWQKYKVWYPSELEEGISYPLVIMANGTGTKASQYEAVFRHLASWGFILAGNEDENSRTGESSAATLDFVLKQNEDKTSPLYGKVDTEHIGITGHSQGGVGAINAVTQQENGEVYKAIFAISATSRYHADELNKSGEGWSVDLTKINIPIMMAAGTGAFDAGSMSEYAETLPDGKAQGICPLWWLNECYETIPGDVDKVIARQTNKDHGDMLQSADGYMTAWFMYYLKRDAEAGEAFFGENAEIKVNGKWQDVLTSR